MAVKVTLTDGKIIFLPDSWTDDQIDAHVAGLGDREPESDYGAAFMRGLGKHAPDIIDLGAGITGIAADITGLESLDRTEASIRDFSDNVRTHVGGEAMRDVSDTFGEKVAEGFGAIPGITASFAPTLAIPGGGVIGSAVKFGAHGAAMAGGEGPGSPIGGALQGAAMGAAFGAMGGVASGIKNPIGRRLTHGIGTTGLVTGTGVIGGEDPEDAFAMGLSMGAVGALGKNPYKADILRQQKIKKILDQVRKENPRLNRDELDQIVALRFNEQQRLDFDAAGGKEQIFSELGLSIDPKSKPFIDEAFAERVNMMNSVRDRIKAVGHEEALKSMPEEQVKQLFTADPYSLAEAAEAVRNYSPTKIRELSDKWGVKGQILGEHEMIKINLLGKMMIRDFADLYMKRKTELEIDVQRGASKVDIEKRQGELENIRDSYTLEIADWVGLGTEMGRAFHARQVVAESTPIGERALERMIAKSKNPIPAHLVERILENPDDFSAAHDVVRASVNPKKVDYLYEVWINGLLSGPPTHAVNMLSNTVTQFMSTAERGVAGTLDFVTSTGKTRAQRSRFAGELFADMRGYWPGIQAGIREASQILRNEQYGYEISKLDKPMANIQGLKGQMIRAPSRVLRMADVFFKNVGAQRELYATAYRHAQRGTNKDGSAFTKAQKTKKIQEIIAEPSELVLERMNAAGKMEKKTLGPKPGTGLKSSWMDEAGQISTFTNPLTGMFKKGAELRDIPSMRWVMPFVRTPMNIMKYGVKRTPLNIPHALHTYGRYRNGEINKSAVVEEAAATLMGTAIAGTIYMAAKEGLVTGGGPSDWQEEMNLRETGWRPYSLKTGGGKYLSYSRVEPLATIFGMAADASEIHYDDPDAADKIIAAIKENLTNKTFMVGLENLAKAWADPDRFAEGYAKIMLGSFVPSALGQVSNITDPYVRTADLRETVHGIPEAMARRIPGLSEQLPIRYNPMGEPVERRERHNLFVLPENIARGASAFEVGTYDPSKFVEEEMANLSQYQGMPPSMPTTSVTINMTDSPYGDTIKLTDDEYAIYHQYHRQARQHMGEAILSPDWAAMTPDIKASMLGNIYRGYQRQAREVIKQQVYNRITGVDIQ